MCRRILAPFFVLLLSRVNAIGQEERATSLQSDVGKVNRLIERSEISHAVRVDSPAKAYARLRALIGRPVDAQESVKGSRSPIRDALTEREAEELANLADLLDRAPENDRARAPLEHRLLDILQGPSQERILGALRRDRDHPDGVFLDSLAVLRCQDLIWSSGVFDPPISVAVEVRALTRAGGRIVLTGVTRIRSRGLAEYRTDDERRRIGALHTKAGRAEEARTKEKDAEKRKRAESEGKDARAEVSKATRDCDELAARRKEVCETVEINVSMATSGPQAADEAKLAVAKRLTVVGKVTDFEFRPAVAELKEPAGLASLTLTCLRIED